MTKPRLRIGLIGTGFMGKAHVFGFTSAPRVFDLPFDLELHTVADITPETAAEAARRLGFAHATANWRNIIADPDIDVVSITAPNALHKEMSLAAIAAEKHVYCEKPLAPLAQDALEMTLAAEAAGLKTQVGFNYLCNPMLALARDMIQAGELGEIRGYRGIHCEDYMADPEGVFTFRHDPQGGGALADIGSHIIAMARHLIGEIAEVSGTLHTAHPLRKDAQGIARAVRIDDQMDALVRFAGGATGTLSASWIATGRKMGLGFEVSGTRGSIAFTQERFNELQLYRAGPGINNGFTTIMAGPGHGEYGAFCPASGHQIGYNDLKTIEVKAAIDAVLGDSTSAKDFADALKVEQVADAIRTSHREARWFALQP